MSAKNAIITNMVSTINGELLKSRYWGLLGSFLDSLLILRLHSLSRIILTIKMVLNYVEPSTLVGKSFDYYFSVGEVETTNRPFRVASEEGFGVLHTAAHQRYSLFARSTSYAHVWEFFQKRVFAIVYALYLLLFLWVLFIFQVTRNSLINFLVGFSKVMFTKAFDLVGDNVCIFLWLSENLPIVRKQWVLWSLKDLALDLFDGVWVHDLRVDGAHNRQTNVDQGVSTF